MLRVGFRRLSGIFGTPKLESLIKMREISEAEALINSATEAERTELLFLSKALNIQPVGAYLGKIMNEPGFKNRFLDGILRSVDSRPAILIADLLPDFANSLEPYSGFQASLMAKITKFDGERIEELKGNLRALLEIRTSHPRLPGPFNEEFLLAIYAKHKSILPSSVKSILVALLATGNGSSSGVFEIVDDLLARPRFLTKTDFLSIIFGLLRISAAKPADQAQVFSKLEKIENTKFFLKETFVPLSPVVLIETLKFLNASEASQKLDKVWEILYRIFRENVDTQPLDFTIIALSLLLEQTNRLSIYENNYFAAVISDSFPSLPPPFKLRAGCLLAKIAIDGHFDFKAQLFTDLRKQIENNPDSFFSSSIQLMALVDLASVNLDFKGLLTKLIQEYKAKGNLHPQVEKYMQSRI